MSGPRAWAWNTRGSTTSRPRRASVDPGEDLRQPALAGDRRLLRALHLRLRAFACRARTADHAGGTPAFARQRPPDGQDRMGSELGGNPRWRVRQAVARLQF